MHLTTKSALVNVIVKACTKTLKPLLRDFGELENLQVSKKGVADFVTNADVRTEEILREELARARPAFGFLGEEGGATDEGAEARFIIDPIDGTSNFMHGIPHFCISVGVEKAGEIIAGVVFDPVKNEIFWAEKGMGAFVNNRKLYVSGRKNLKESLLATGIPFAGHGDQATFLKTLKNVMPACAGVRRFGASALDLAYVAAGRYEGYFEDMIKPWDIAAGIILVREAGGMVTDYEEGNDMLTNNKIVASNGILHKDIINLIL